MAVRRSYTATVERNVLWKDEFATEPYEAAWASEAIFYVRALAVSPDFSGSARVQISPDGIHWADEGASFDLPIKDNEVTFCKVAHFGGWLRLYGTLDDEASITVLVSLALKE